MKTILAWIPFAFVVSLICLLGYGLVQQSLRQSANDPQIQMAEDAALSLAKGAKPADVIPANQVDMSVSLLPYMMVFDDSGKVLASSVNLHGVTPVLPGGILAAARESEWRETWQPEIGVRSAVVALRFGGANPGFVLAGRSLREVEVREDHTSFISFAALVFGLVGTFVILFCVVALNEKWTKK